MKILTACERRDLSSRGSHCQGKDAAEQVRQTNCFPKPTFKAVKINQVCSDEHARGEDGSEDCSNDESNEVTGEGDEDNCQVETKAAKYIKRFLWKLENPA